MTYGRVAETWCSSFFFRTTLKRALENTSSSTSVQPSHTSNASSQKRNTFFTSDKFQQRPNLIRSSSTSWSSALLLFPVDVSPALVLTTVCVKILQKQEKKCKRSGRPCQSSRPFRLFSSVQFPSHLLIVSRKSSSLYFPERTSVLDRKQQVTHYIFSSLQGVQITGPARRRVRFKMNLFYLFCTCFMINLLTHQTCHENSTIKP